jgi:hypothetical protein
METNGLNINLLPNILFIFYFERLHPSHKNVIEKKIDFDFLLGKRQKTENLKYKSRTKISHLEKKKKFFQKVTLLQIKGLTNVTQNKKQKHFLQKI